MSADISELGNLNSSEPLDLDLYADVKEAFELPRKGRYTVRAPDSFPNEAFGATKAGYLSAQVDPTIMGPTSEGFQIRFTKVSAKTYERGGLTVSQVGDYLRACGFRGGISGDPGDIKAAIQTTAGKVYQVDLDWRAYNKNTGFVVEGMENFPKDELTGNHKSWTVDLGDIDPDTGEPRRILANLTVRRFVPAT